MVNEQLIVELYSAVTVAALCERPGIDSNRIRRTLS